ncbi:MAG: AAA-like domain-containing protein, partial [Prevotellaceae bacterium]|nr:AAA-like domain-containing protein [Prevotellaceae bacterium]
CNKAKHYMIESSTRLQGVEQLIDMEQYFVIHAARQSGKTTYLKDLVQWLNAEGKYYALYCSLESVQNIVDPEKGIPAILRILQSALKYSKFPHIQEFASDVDPKDYNIALKESLTDYCMLLDKPLVIFFDEADCLSDETLIMFLRQLRNGYNERSSIPFVHSVALVGMRNIRDYKARIRPNSQSMGSASPFNIITEAMTLKNFTKEEITMLYGQHTEDTGQIFEPAAIELVWEQTQGQPWLVNAIAREVIVEMLQSDYTRPVTADMVEQAIQTIILRRDTHIDSLLERLKEDRVRKVVEAVIMGDYVSPSSDDFHFTCDLGLIRMTEQKTEPANPIYAEVIVRTLNYDMQCYLQQNVTSYQIPRYLKNGRIDMDFLMRDFQQFWRENSEIWIRKFDYGEAAPHLILMAFLQRVINGGGQIIREMAAGTGRLDICLIYENRKYPIELKIRYGEKYVEKGIEQTARYMDTLGCSEGWLAVFDRRTTVKWDDKLFMKKETVEGKTVTVVGL